MSSHSTIRGFFLSAATICPARVEATIAPTTTYASALHLSPLPQRYTNERRVFILEGCPFFGRKKIIWLCRGCEKYPLSCSEDASICVPGARTAILGGCMPNEFACDL